MEEILSSWTQFNLKETEKHPDAFTRILRGKSRKKGVLSVLPRKGSWCNLRFCSEDVQRTRIGNLLIDTPKVEKHWLKSRSWRCKNSCLPSVFIHITIVTSPWLFVVIICAPMVLRLSHISPISHWAARLVLHPELICMTHRRSSLVRHDASGIVGVIDMEILQFGEFDYRPV